MTFKILLASDCIIDWKSSPHMLVSSITGSTMTNTHEDILLPAISTKGRLDGQSQEMCAKTYLIDGKGADLMLNPAVTPNQAARMLRILTQDMHKRYEHFSGEYGKTASDYLINGK